VLGLFLTFPGTGRSGPINYSFTLIGATSPDTTAAQINNSGTVVFAKDSASTILAGNELGLTVVADTSERFGSFSNFGIVPSINNAGTVAFQGTIIGGREGIFSGSGGPLTTIAGTNGPVVVRGFSFAPRINDTGTVAFVASLNNNTGIFTGSGGPITTIVDTSGPFSSFLADSLAINRKGTIAFSATLNSGQSGIFTASNGLIATLYDTSGHFTYFTRLSMNDDGIIAFHAILDTGLEGIFVGNGGTVTTIADTSGPFRSLGQYPSINNEGMVAFKAFLQTGGVGIYTGQGPIADKVIATGDSLFGSVIRNLDYLGPRAFNDSSQIVFRVDLADGRSVVVRADPVAAAIPEPSVLALMVLGIIVLLGYSWLRKLPSTR
jgi:hypothetical protein